MSQAVLLLAITRSAYLVIAHVADMPPTREHTNLLRTHAQYSPRKHTRPTTNVASTRNILLMDSHGLLFLSQALEAYATLGAGC